MKTGKIIITDKVYFEYYELPEPSPDDYFEPQSQQISGRFWKKLQLHKASKQLVEVSNGGKQMEKDCFYSKFYQIEAKKGDWVFWIKDRLFVVKNNQPCKASIKDNKATIIELI